MPPHLDHSQITADKNYKKNPGWDGSGCPHPRSPYFFLAAFDFALCAS